MDWELAIKRNREALQRIVAALFALAGLVGCETHSSLPRHLYRAVLRVLRPAESAVRRLIFISARGMNFGNSLLNSANAAKANAQLWQELSKLPPKFTAFCLIDPLKRFTFNRVQYISGPPPRISVPGFLDPVFAVPVLPSSEDPIQAECIIRRLKALKAALENLPKQARRLARWQAKRALERGQLVRKPKRLSQFRLGLPPGYRSRPIHEIDGILKECHGLALDIGERRDSS